MMPAMARERVLLAQLPIPPLDAAPIRGNVPLAAGYLKMLARTRGLEEGRRIDILPAEESNALGDVALVEEICAREPDLLGFTCYLWNIDRTLWVAGRVKERLPRCEVIIGGPEVTPDNDWVLSHPAIDLAAIGEGEQTFCELLEGRPLPEIAGLVHGGKRNPPRFPMPSLDAVSSPYLAGILDAGDQEQLLLETVRGCLFRCKFCYYPKAYDGLYFLSREKILANLAHARARGAREVYLLDPTLNQRRDLPALLETLGEGNPDGSLEFFAELRGEGITGEQARLMREANFREVEIGLQSIDPTAQERMDRRSNLKAFERGVRALQAAGVPVKVDLIVGLPGDTAETIRAGMRWLAENRLYDDVQVFPLSILPGTAFREEAASLGLRFQPHPPYYVLETPTLRREAMLDLLEEAEEVFGLEFDPVPPVTLSPAGWRGLPGEARIDLGRPAAPLTPGTPQAFTLRFSGVDLYRHLPLLQSAVRQHLARNPFSTLQVLLETETHFPFDVFDGLRAAFHRPERCYLDRFYEMVPGRGAGARRIAVLFPESGRDRLPPGWAEDAEEYAELLFGASSPPPRALPSR